MKHQRSTCTHTTSEEQYICVETTCRQKKDYKLDCLRCLQSEHLHNECILHISHIVNEAQVKQQQFVKLIGEYQSFSTNLKEKQSLIIENMRRQINIWLDNQKDVSIQQIELYEKELVKQKSLVESAKLVKENIKDVLDFMHFNDKDFIQKNAELQLILENNQSQLNKYLDNHYERLIKYFKCQEINEKELPKIDTKFRVQKIINHEKCAEIGCTQQDKIKLCLDKSCLNIEKLELECPSCQMVKHHEQKNIEQHQKCFQQSYGIWELQNQYIDAVEQFCEKWSSDIRNESQVLQDKIDECQKLNELKLYQFKQFVKENEQEILQTLRKFKSQYQKDYFQIYKELLLRTDFSILSGVNIQFAKFKIIAESFTRQSRQEENLTVDQYLDLWSKGLCYIQQHKILQDGDNLLNKSIQQIQELKEKMEISEVQYSQTIEQLNDELSQSKRSSYLSQKFVSEIDTQEQEIDLQIKNFLEEKENGQKKKIQQLEEQKKSSKFAQLSVIQGQIQILGEEYQQYIKDFNSLVTIVKKSLQNVQLNFSQKIE